MSELVCVCACVCMRACALVRACQESPEIGWAPKETGKLSKHWRSAVKAFITSTAGIGCAAVRREKMLPDLVRKPFNTLSILGKLFTLTTRNILAPASFTTKRGKECILTGTSLAGVPSLFS